ncbi:MAG: hypothetical protein B6D63_06755 [Candidatus Latescibacteria bacterium 4484_7]|nr:MAG: hypothetical protein B6D63_06755 [Candidatus Latescibacteria bacterium 4484_7]
MKIELFLSTPIEKLVESIPFLADNDLHPEVRMAKVDYIMNLDMDEAKRIGDELSKRGLRVFTHGPFFGLDIASMDRHISEYTAESLIRGIETTAALGAEVMVMHSGFIPFFSRGGRRHWLRNWSERMLPVLDRARESGVTVALENTWEERPELFAFLVEQLPEGSIAVCIDTGHLNVFSHISVWKWWQAVGDRVVAMHLHDNDGTSDDHLAPGRGTFDFAALGEILSKRDTLPLLDLEIDREQALRGKDYLEALWGGL